MIDLNDLTKMHICTKCNCVFYEEEEIWTRQGCVCNKCKEEIKE